MSKLNYTPSRFMLPTSFYDKRRADFAVAFIQMLKLTKGEWYGQPFKLMPWQETIVRDIFGIVDKETGYRQFRTAYVEVAKKNAKSELAAAVALYLLLADNEAGAEVYSVAADINQAGIVYSTAKTMIQLSPDLSAVTKIVPSTKRILFPHTNSFYRVLSSDVKNKFGYNVSGLIFDELCAQPSRELYDTMTKYAGDARRQPLNFVITTAGRDKNSICYEVHAKAKDILEGRKVDPAFYPIVYGMEDGDDWNDPEVWKNATHQSARRFSLRLLRRPTNRRGKTPPKKCFISNFA